MQILLIKNPVGATEVLRTLALEGSGLTLLAVLNDRIADGRDVSWIWDADFELLAGQIASVTCAGTRAADMATRLQYAGVDPARIRVEPDLASALELAATDGTGTLYAVPTYTAMLELRGLLEQRGEIERAWA
jgi:UDP-N-acetylmuramyl tripeptide synthase